MHAMKNHHIHKIFIANRGEIALRVIKSAHKMGITTILPVWAEEKETLPAKLTDELHILDETSIKDTFLDGERMVELAKTYQADAIHPGYGFLSESSNFANLVINAGLLWIGPSPDAIAKMGNKLTARKIAQNAGVTVTKGLEGSHHEILNNHSNLRFPLLIKASRGGGGKGMRIAHDASELETMLADAAREAYSSFGEGTVYVEEYIEAPRHIEVQILGDHHGNIVHLFERECSIQRRYQKIIEEAPSPSITKELREKITADALKLCHEIEYYNAGTVEFLVDTSGHHYFLEMNTRLQVEHPVTEAITGMDIVKEQIMISMNHPLSVLQENIEIWGHAIEARLYAEDPSTDFSPTPGEIYDVSWPNEKIVRTDTFFNKGLHIQPQFDPMLAKIIAHGATRKASIQKLSEGLAQTNIIGITTNMPYLRHILKFNPFLNGETTTHFINLHHKRITQAIELNGRQKTQLLLAAYTIWLNHHRIEHQHNLWENMGHKRWNGNHSVRYNNHNCAIKIVLTEKSNTLFWENDHKRMPNIENISFSNHELSFHLNNQLHKFRWNYVRDKELLLGIDGYTYRLQPDYIITKERSANKFTDETSNNIKAPIPGRITKTLVTRGQKIEKGETLFILEAMKMENTITAPSPGIVKTLHITEGDQVKAGQLMCLIEKLGEPLS
jgi:acetyl/propionyl-CoA carboxylase alpha subunit